MAGVLRVLGVAGLACGLCLAQVGPPVCAVPAGKQVPSLRPAVGLEVFFITGRPRQQRVATAKNLEATGYKGWKGLALREGAQKTMATVAY